jgi:cytoskeletal protein RodZ
MSGIHCNNCGAELDEAPTLLPDRRPPCPRCGSLARRFEQEVTNTVALSDGGTATDALSVVEPNGSATIAHAEPATLTVAAHDASVSVQAHAEVAQGAGEAFDLTVQTVNVHGIPSADQVGDATVVRGPRIIRDHLVVQARSLWWTQLTDKGGWLLQVVDEAGEEIAIAANHDPVEALAAVAKFVLPGHPG